MHIYIYICIIYINSNKDNIKDINKDNIKDIRDHIILKIRLKNVYIYIIFKYINRDNKAKKHNKDK